MGELDGKVILVVDDEQDLRELVAEAFRDYGAKTREAESGKRAIEVLKSETIHAVISDVRMPNGDGFFLLDQMKALEKRPPVVLMSGHSDLSEKDAMARGAERLISKPFNLDDLIQFATRLVN